jgi:hypothetical protein
MQLYPEEARSVPPVALNLLDGNSGTQREVVDLLEHSLYRVSRVVEKSSIVVHEGEPYKFH